MLLPLDVGAGGDVSVALYVVASTFGGVATPDVAVASCGDVDASAADVPCAAASAGVVAASCAPASAGVDAACCGVVVAGAADAPCAAASVGAADASCVAASDGVVAACCVVVVVGGGAAARILCSIHGPRQPKMGLSPTGLHSRAVLSHLTLRALNMQSRLIERAFNFSS